MTFSIMTFSIMTFTIMTFTIMAFSIMTFSIMAFSIMAFSIMTFSIMAFIIMPISIMGLFAKLSINVTQLFYHYPECHLQYIVMLNVVMLSVVAHFVGLKLSGFKTRPNAIAEEKIERKNNLNTALLIMSISK